MGRGLGPGVISLAPLPLPPPPPPLDFTDSQHPPTPSLLSPHLYSAHCTPL